MSPGSYERLVDRFVLMTWYRVQASSVEEFVALQRRASEIYARHALSWSLEHDTQEGEHWRESGPRFREQADLRAAAKAFDAEPGLLEWIAAFALDRPPGAHAFAGGWTHLSSSQPVRWERSCTLDSTTGPH
jgi:hypothetical protein